jgi:hypothetical protein
MDTTRTKIIHIHRDAMVSSDEDEDTNLHSTRHSFRGSSTEDLATTSLRFVTVTAKSLNQHRSELNTDEARHVRRYCQTMSDGSEYLLSPLERVQGS